MTLYANTFSISTMFSMIFSRTRKSEHLRSFAEKEKPRNHYDFKVFYGAAGQIRTADLILTNRSKAIQPLLYKAFGRFFVQKG